MDGEDKQNQHNIYFEILMSSLITLLTQHTFSHSDEFINYVISNGFHYHSYVASVKCTWLSIYYHYYYYYCNTTDIAAMIDILCIRVDYNLGARDRLEFCFSF